MRRPPSLQFNSSAPFVDGSKGQEGSAASQRAARYLSGNLAVATQFIVSGRHYVVGLRRSAAAAAAEEEEEKEEPRLSRPPSGMESKQTSGSARVTACCPSLPPLDTVPEVCPIVVGTAQKTTQPAELRTSFHVGSCRAGLLARWPCQCGTETCRHGTGSRVPLSLVPE